jgi:hypothetical protein
VGEENEDAVPEFKTWLATWRRPRLGGTARILPEGRRNHLLKDSSSLEILHLEQRSPEIVPQKRIKGDEGDTSYCDIGWVINAECDYVTSHAPMLRFRAKADTGPFVPQTRQ